MRFLTSSLESSDDDLSDNDAKETDPLNSERIQTAERERILLEELRSRYRFEASRQQSVESKTSIIVGVNAIIVSLLPTLSFDPAATILVVVMAISSIFTGAIVLRPRQYSTVGEDDLEDSLRYLDPSNEIPIVREFTLEYVKSIKNNRNNNNIKYDCYKVMLSLTFSSIILLSLFVLRETACSVHAPGLPDLLYPLLGGICQYQGVIVISLLAATIIWNTIQEFGTLVLDELSQDDSDQS